MKLFSIIVLCKADLKQDILKKAFDLTSFNRFQRGTVQEPHCPILNMNEKKTEQVPIQLPNIARTLSDAKIIKKKFFPWTSEIIQFIRFEN